MSLGLRALASSLGLIRPWGEPSMLPPGVVRMLAVNSDVEFTTWDRQLRLLELAAEAGVELASSLWFFADPEMTWRLFEDDLTPSPVGEAAMELVGQGWFDTVHSFGGRLHRRGVRFTRQDIGAGYAELERRGLRIPVFTNHGTTEDKQNLGGPWVGTPGHPSYQEGDLPGSPLYHLDLTLRHGVRFFWTDIDLSRERCWFRADHRGPDALFVPQTSRDGSPVLRFRRFWRARSPDAEWLDSEIETALADPAPGYSVLYTHLGVRRDPAGRPLAAASGDFEESTRRALDRLATARSGSGTLVTTTSRLLANALVASARPFGLAPEGDGLTVRLSSTCRLPGGPEVRLAWEDFQGLSIPLDRPLAVRACLDGETRELSIEVGRHGTHAVLPWETRAPGPGLEEARRLAGG